MARLSIYQKAANQRPNDILVEDILYYVRAIKLAKTAILSCVTDGKITLDEDYVKEKLDSVRTYNKRLIACVEEARYRVRA